MPDTAGEERMERPVRIGALTIDGAWPIVILGPNGSGKTRLGSDAVSKNPGAERISAKRMVLPPDQLHFQSEEDAKNNYERQKTHFKTQIYQYASEFQTLIFKLFAEDAASAMSYRDQRHNAQTTDNVRPEVTKFIRIQKLWREVFPCRDISLRKNGLRVEASHLSEKKEEYPASQMSDGELVAFYMISRVVDANPGILIIDEPELHLHFSLSKSLWDALEDFRKDIRFVYITHNVHFAESRRNAKVIILRPGRAPEQIPSIEALPEELVNFLLGAASGSVKSNKVLFCEGEAGGLDERIYRAWIKDPNIPVVPVGGCKTVVSCYDIVSAGRLLPGLLPTAIIDRDDKSDDELDHLRKKGVFISQYSEIEALLCSKAIFSQIGSQLLQGSDLEAKYESFLVQARSIAQKNLNSRVLERCKRKSEWKLAVGLNNISCDEQLDGVRVKFVQKCRDLPSEIDPENTFQAEVERLKGCLSAEDDSVLHLFPGKSVLAQAAKSLGVKQEVYIDIAHKVILGNRSEPELQKKCEQLRVEVKCSLPVV